MSSSTRVLKEWVERDLSEEAATLPVAFEVDDAVRRLGDVIIAGRHPIVSGPSGVGKSALVVQIAFIASIRSRASL